jgi:hypothetical protein
MTPSPGSHLSGAGPVSTVKIACPNCHPSGFDIAPLEELLSIAKDAHPNLAPVHQRLDMLRTDRVMALFADDRDRFGVRNPGVTCMHDFLHHEVNAKMCEALRSQGYTLSALSYEEPDLRSRTHKIYETF